MSVRMETGSNRNSMMNSVRNVNPASNNVTQTHTVVNSTTTTRPVGPGPGSVHSGVVVNTNKTTYTTTTTPSANPAVANSTISNNRQNAAAPASSHGGPVVVNNNVSYIPNNSSASMRNVPNNAHDAAGSQRNSHSGNAAPAVAHAPFVPQNGGNGGVVNPTYSPHDPSDPQNGGKGGVVNPTNDPKAPASRSRAKAPAIPEGPPPRGSQEGWIGPNLVITTFIPFFVATSMQIYNLKLALIIAASIALGNIIAGLLFLALKWRKVWPYIMEVAMLVVYVVLLAVIYINDDTDFTIKRDFNFIVNSAFAGILLISMLITYPAAVQHVQEMVPWGFRGRDIVLENGYLVTAIWTIVFVANTLLYLIPVCKGVEFNSRNAYNILFRIAVPDLLVALAVLFARFVPAWRTSQLRQVGLDDFGQREPAYPLVLMNKARIVDAAMYGAGAAGGFPAFVPSRPASIYPGGPPQTIQGSGQQGQRGPPTIGSQSGHGIQDDGPWPYGDGLQLQVQKQQQLLHPPPSSVAHGLPVPGSDTAGMPPPQGPPAYGTPMYQQHSPVGYSTVRAVDPSVYAPQATAFYGNAQAGPQAGLQGGQQQQQQQDGGPVVIPVRGGKRIPVMDGGGNGPARGVVQYSTASAIPFGSVVMSKDQLLQASAPPQQYDQRSHVGGGQQQPQQQQMYSQQYTATAQQYGPSGQPQYNVTNQQYTQQYTLNAQPASQNSRPPSNLGASMRSSLRRQ